MEDRRAGVTLAEILTVLVILGILSAIAAPSLRAMIARHQAVGALNQLAGDLMLARMTAVREGHRVVVTFADGGRCGPPRFGRFTADSYRITTQSPVPRLIRETRLDEAGAGVCLESNNDRTIVYSSRGLPIPFENRRVWARRWGESDTLVISVLGRMRRY